MIEREGDIGSSENRHFLRLHRQEDGDIIVQAAKLSPPEYRTNQVEFCTIGPGGGKSPETYLALINVIEAIKKDNLEEVNIDEKPKTGDDVSQISKTQERQGDMGEFERKNYLRVHLLEDKDILVEVISPNDTTFPGSTSVGFCQPEAGGQSPSLYKTLNRLFEAMEAENNMEEELGNSP